MYEALALAAAADAETEQLARSIQKQERETPKKFGRCCLLWRNEASVRWSSQAREFSMPVE
jgi:hypothetical protein